MKIQKQLLDFEDEQDELIIGLARLSVKIPDHELFFKINSSNEFDFSRVEDVIIRGYYYDYFFSRFEAYHHDTKTCFKFISNKSINSVQKKEQKELFATEEEIKFLLNDYQEVDYIITSSDTYPDFSLILLPENIMFQIQNFSISSNDELYNVIQYYE